MTGDPNRSLTQVHPTHSLQGLEANTYPEPSVSTHSTVGSIPISDHSIQIGIHKPTQAWSKTRKALSLPELMQTQDEWTHGTQAEVTKEIVKNVLGVAAIAGIGLLSGGAGLAVVAGLYGGAAFIAAKRLYGHHQHQNTFFQNSLNPERLNQAVHTIANEDNSPAAKQLAVRYSAAKEAGNAREQMRILDELQEQTGYVIDFSKFHKDFDNAQTSLKTQHSPIRSDWLVHAPPSPPVDLLKHRPAA
ncbi:MAG: hypothetical protein I8H75_04190 [Myxococcaceae bacterium]|nr:hypothetical protein [Myxococcaceae bacterium]